MAEIDGDLAGKTAQSTGERIECRRYRREESRNI